MTFGNYIYQDNTSQSRQAAINQLIDTADNLEAGHLKAVEAASQLKTTIANLDMNEAEDGFKEQLQADLEQTIENNVQYGNMYYVLDDIIKKSGDILSNPAVIGRLKAQQDYKAFRDELSKRIDIPEYMKDMYIDKNPYYYEDKYSQDGSKIIGSSKWEPVDRPVSYIDDTKMFEEVIKFTRPDVTSGESLKFYDINGKEVGANSEDIVSAAIIDKYGNMKEEVTGDKLFKSVIGLYEHNQAYQAHINQKIEYAKWAKEHGDDTDYGLYTASGVERSPLEFVQYTFVNSIEGSKYRKLVTSRDVNLFNPYIFKGGGGGDTNATPGYGDLGGESAGTTNRTANTTENVNGNSSNDMAAKDGITF